MIPRIITITSNELRALGFIPAARVRVLHGPSAGLEGVIKAIDHHAIPFNNQYGKEEETEGFTYHTTITTRLEDNRPECVACFYNPAYLEIIE